MSISPFADLRQRCAAQDAALDARLRALLAAPAPSKRRQSAAPAAQAWLRAGTPQVVERVSMLRALRGADQARAAAQDVERQRSPMAFGGVESYMPRSPRKPSKGAPTEAAKLRAERNEQIHTLAAQGMAKAVIAREVGCHVATVRQTLKAAASTVI